MLKDSLDIKSSNNKIPSNKEITTLKKNLSKPNIKISTNKNNTT